MTHTHGGTPLPIDDEMLSEYLDGNLSPGDEEAVRRAIGTDSAVRDRYRELAATVALLRTLPSPAPSRSFTLSAEQARLARETLHAPTPIPLPVQAPFAAAAPMPTPASNVTPLRPASRVNRLTPLLGAFGAIAAVLLVVLITADFATGGFRGATATTRSNSAQIEQTTPPPAALTAATTSAGAVGTSAPGATVVSATVAPSAPVGVPGSSSGTTSGIPLAVVRAVEIALAMIAVAGLAGAIGSVRVRRHQSTLGP